MNTTLDANVVYIANRELNVKFTLNSSKISEG